uniref:YEATS domain-containing protein n=1 Tax=Trypanosoma congolense (strain IL3000) TaxID=1068625 RepID=G0UXU6_TRYCI|nr:conserved hypothetical protein [Trypanosoma congolense IL3000]
MASARRSGNSSSSTGEHEYVVYTGAALIPFCVGSVALPINLCRASDLSRGPTPIASNVAPLSRASKKRKRSSENGRYCRKSSEEDNGDNVHDYCAGISRCTHVRYAYLRDGSLASLDLSYRRQLLSTPETSHAQSKQLSSKDSDLIHSASQLYSVIDRVVFTLPNGFPERRKEVTCPPFFIVDDTWAEHLVEMEVHFRPWLGIKPFTVSHMVLLNQRVDITPQLLSSTQGQCKPPSTVILSPDEAGQEPSIEVQVASREGKSASNNPKVTTSREASTNSGSVRHNFSPSDVVIIGEGGLSVRLEDLVGAPVVSERRDAIRIFHPTLNVVRHLAAVRAMEQPKLMVPPRVCVLPWFQHQQTPENARGDNLEDCDEGFNCRRTKRSRPRPLDSSCLVDVNEVDSATGLPPWCFPFEPIIHAYEAGRQVGAASTMRAVREALRQEQLELRENIEQCISAATANAEELRVVIQRMRESCEALKVGWKR